MTRLFTMAIAITIALGSAGSVASAGVKEIGANPPVRVEMTQEGPVFARKDGKTLYFWAREDVTPGKALCTNERFTTMKLDPVGILPLPAASKRKACIDKWPPLYAQADARTDKLWSLVTRPDGTKQWAYSGHPLYGSIKDKNPGDVNGATGMTFDREWRPALAPLDFPAGLKLIRRIEGLVLATPDDRLLFWRSPTGRACNDCSPQMQALVAPMLATTKGDWSVVEADTGQQQYAFKRHALYRAPDGLGDKELLASADWQPAIYRKAAPVPSPIKTTLTLLGNVYSDTNGRVLYVFDCSFGPDGLPCNDPGDGASYIAGLCGSGVQCANQWRPLLAERGARSVGEWSVEDVAVPLFTDAADVTYPPDTPRVKAWAYRGRPVYTFADDQPGQMLGHGIKQTNVAGFYVVQIPGNRETGR
jgi:predicted lipoprotein with Yx(FWY)xxD motif